MQRAEIRLVLRGRGNIKFKSPKEGTRLAQKNIFGSDASKPSHILELTPWTSTTLGMVSGTTSWVCWGELMRSSLSNT